MTPLFNIPAATLHGNVSQAAASGERRMLQTHAICRHPKWSRSLCPASKLSLDHC